MAELTHNMNYLTPNGFKIIIDRKNYANLQYFAQRVQHPSMDVNATEQPYRRISSVPVIGDKITHNQLQIDLILDEDMNAYTELYDWMHRMVEEPHNLSSLDPNNPSHYADLTVEVLTSHNNSNKKLTYRNAFPTTLGDVEFTSITDGEYLTVPTSFRFDYFELV